VVLALTGYLGTWQKNRADEKRALQAEYEARAILPPVPLTRTSRDVSLRYRLASATGQWRSDDALFIDNRHHGTRAGFHVIVPLELAGGARVLVNRGWVARDASYPSAPRTALPMGEGVAEGLLVVPTTRFIELAPDTRRGAVWQNLSIERYRETSGHDVLPFVLLERTPPQGFVAVTERPDARVAKHVEYMWTWYSLAATVLVLWLALNVSRFATGEGRS
jgi:surfeit locus 1 family protein